MDRHNPSFFLLPVNNNRTAWQKVRLPVVMVVPHARRSSDSSTFNLRIFIEDVPQEAFVSGHDNIGRRHPDRERYAVNLTQFSLTEKFIDTGDYPFFDGQHNPVDADNAKEGDYFQFTTQMGVTGLVPYLPDAYYYDLSEVEIETEILESGRYNLVYQTDYFARVISQDNLQEFLCIDTDTTVVSRFEFLINHPGEVLDEFYRSTPSFHLNESSKAEDSTVKLYRPFTDALQNIYDEQDLLKSANWVSKVPAEAIPYLSALLGWEIPYFPESLDSLRRAVLRKTVEFQNLAGSKRALTNIFNLFGFEILISNLWWSQDGQRYIRPGERLPDAYADQTIQVEHIAQVDLLLSDYSEPGFSQLEIPLLFRPQSPNKFEQFGAAPYDGDITIEAFLVEVGSPDHDKLLAVSQSLTDNPEQFGGQEGYFIDNEGYLSSISVISMLDDVDPLGYNRLLIQGVLGQVASSVVYGQAPLADNTVAFDRETNNLRLSLSGHMADPQQRVFAFATYQRQHLTIPEQLKNLQSNRFDIQVLTQDDQFADPTTLEFAIEFLYRLKAFHSILNVIRTRVDNTETYLVGDWCVGGDITMRYDTDAGTQQVPPAIIPNDPQGKDACSLLDHSNLGYKESDIKFRLAMLANLDQEVSQSTQQRVEPERTEENQSVTDPQEAHQQQAAHPLGFSQELVVNKTNLQGEFIKELTGLRQTIQQLTGADYCYQGRVEDELLHQSAVVPTETYYNKPCSIGMGTGTYYTLPAYSRVLVQGVKKPAPHSRSYPTQFSGGAAQGNIRHYLLDEQAPYLQTSYDQPLPNKNNSHLGRLYRSYGTPTGQTLHYSDRGQVADQRQQLALQRPSLNIDKHTLHLPGCRFPMLGALQTDYTSNDYQARPWDDPFSRSTGCGKPPSWLGATLEVGTDGNEYLVFENRPYIAYGNGLTPDIDGLGGDNVAPSDPVVHKVYANISDSPYVELEGTCITATETIQVTDPIFTSHSLDNPAEDFVDGYACESGPFTASPQDFSQWNDVVIGLGVPMATGDYQALFTLSSGIRSEMGLRLDCGCSVVGQDETICNLENYWEDDSPYWGSDHLESDVRLAVDDEIGVQTTLLDGTIDNLLTLS